MKKQTSLKSDVATALSSVFLRDMPASVAGQLLETAQTYSAVTGEILFDAGEAAENVLIITDGLVKLSRTTRAGAEAVVAVSKAGDSVATALAFGPSLYPVSCHVLKDCRYVAISCAHVQETILSSRESVASVLSATYAHLHQLVEQVEQLKSRSADKRVARFLVLQCKSLTGATSFKLPFDKVVIAGLLGMTPETLSRAFAKLKPKGVEISGQNVSIRRVETLVTFLD
ncbi:Crp/Fnr family transcriptional regulator [Cognatishimia sp. WU-CL00825]|uniref:Crp/Fnr family transcriptional regulator n=1 Tax=Cognatishimia sp. WU-CL00825 TaxID=3127658 RepID=UPI0031082E87